MRTSREDKIFAGDILDSFVYVTSLRGEQIVPFLRYDDKGINELLYEYYKNNKELFADVFKPEWDRDYPKFPHFYGNIQMTSELVFNVRPEVRRFSKLKEYSFLELTKSPLEITLKIGIDIEDKFGCDEKGNKDYRTQIIRIPKGGEIIVPVL